MKKMVCKVCGSSNFKKDGSVFVCQECHTEYSETESRSLFKEVKEGNGLIPSTKGTSLSQRDQDVFTLYTYYEFFKKGHELEDSFFLKDSALTNCSNPFSSSYDGDIATRELNYEKAKMDYLDSTGQIAEVKKRTIAFGKGDEQTQNAYHEYDKYVRYEKRREKFIPLSKFISSFGTLILWGGVLFGIVSCGISGNWGGDYGWLPWIIIIGGFAVSYLGVSFGDPVNENLKREDFESWVTSSVDNRIKTGTFELPTKPKSKYKEPVERNFETIYNDYRASVLKRLDMQEKAFLKKVDELKSIKRRIITAYPLPRKYSDEAQVVPMLSYYLNLRVDSLKEAINLYEEEKFRNELINTINYWGNALDQRLENIQRTMTIQHQELVEAIENIEIAVIVDVNVAVSQN